MSTRNTVLAFGVFLLGACSGSAGAGAVAPLGSAEAAVREFLAAVSDSNITRMGRAWGGSAGPAAVTNDPPKWEQRLKIVQFYLRGGTYRITSNTPDATDPKHRNLNVEFTRGTCIKQLPFVAVQTARGGWLVEAVNISLAGNPLNPCPSPAPASPPGGN